MKRTFFSDISNLVDTDANLAALVARLLGRSLMIFVGAALLIGLSGIVVASWRVVTLSATAALFFSFCLFLHRRGYSALVGTLILFFLLFFSSYTVATGDGIHDTVILLYPVLILLWSLLLRRIWFALLAGTSTSFLLLVGFGELYGWIHNDFSHLTRLDDISTLVIVLLGFSVLVRYLAEVVLEAFTRAAQSEHNYQQVLNAVGEAIFIHDAQTGEILDVNETMLRMYNLEKKELGALSSVEISANRPPYTHKEALLWLEKARTEGPQTFEWLARRRHSDEFWVEVALRRVELGGRECILAVVRDIDERRRAQDERRQAEKLQALGELAGGVAHDFNNQLIGIIGFAELLSFETKEPTQQEHTAAILTAAGRASELTQQLLAFARRGKEETVRFEVRRVVEEALSILSHSLDKRITIRSDLSREGAFVLGDPTQLQNAVLNLAINARDAMPAGGTLTVQLQLTELDGPFCQVYGPEARPGRYIELVVADTGTGMDEETRQRIFEPFFTTKEKGQGTGMGLSMVYGTVKEHGGFLLVESAPEEGSIFRLYLPLDQETKKPESSDDQEIWYKGSEHILVVDDDPVVRAFLQAMLGRLGYRATFCADGVEALDYFQDHGEEVDLVLLDMIMPRLGGGEVLTAMQRLRPDVRVLLTSGYSDDGEREAALAAGAVGFLEKPYRITEASRLLREALRQETNA